MECLSITTWILMQNYHFHLTLFFTKVKNVKFDKKLACWHLIFWNRIKKYKQLEIQWGKHHLVIIDGKLK